jgi:allophanate hydrolase
MAEIAALSDCALFVPAADAREAQRMAAHLRASGDWLEVVAGIDSVSVLFDPIALDMSAATARLDRALATTGEAAPGRTPQTHSIPVHYGGKAGPDLAAICDDLGMGEDELIALHTSLEHMVDMIGFTPGFAYISGLPRDLKIPRLSTPRTHVPAGAIGLTTGRTGTYALPGPGGWPLIGQSDAALFDAARGDPFLLHPGDTVRFVPA